MLSVSSSQPAEKPAPKDSSWASWLLIGIALAAVIALAVINSTGKGTESAAPVSSGETQTIDVGVDGMAFTPSSIDIEPGTHLVVNFTNSGDQVHDLKIGDAETGRVDPGETVQLDAGVIDSSVEGYCTIAGHKMQGMTFQVNVGDGPAAGHDHAVSSASNPHVDVPTAAELGAQRDDFSAFDATLQPAAETKTHKAVSYTHL